MYVGLYSYRMYIVTVPSTDATMSYFSSLLLVAKARYQKKLLLVGLSTGPYELPQQAWVDDVTQWPRVEFPDIVLQLIDAPGEFTREKLKAYYFLSGWVGTCHIHIINEEFCLLKAEVWVSGVVCSLNWEDYSFSYVCYYGDKS